MRRYYDRLAMIDPKTNRQWTYKELDNEVNRLANSLVKDGFGKGDVIMVMTQNCPGSLLLLMSLRRRSVA